MYDRISIGRYGFYKTNRKLSPLFPEQKRFVITARKSAEYRGFSPAQRRAKLTPSSPQHGKTVGCTPCTSKVGEKSDRL